MTRASLTYGGQPLEVEFPDQISVSQYAPRTVSAPVSGEDFATKFEQAGGERRLADDSPLVVVNDGYRTTPTALVLEWLNTLDQQFLDRARFLVAAGTHDLPTEQHLQTIFGAALSRVSGRIAVHRADDLSLMTQVGEDHFGHPVWISQILLDTPRALIIGSVEPHYFAGFAGGRKSIFPGLTDLTTIERNHNLANSLDAQPMRLAGNPVAEHLQEMIAMVDTSGMLSIQLVTDRTGQVAEVYCGSLADSFTAAMEAARAVYSHEADQPFDLVVAEVCPPLDGNLYQVQKALENCQTAVADGGTIVLVSACREGIGSQHFYNQASGWDQKQNQPADGVLRFGSHKLSRVVSISHRIRVFAFCEVSDDDVRRVFYEPLDNLDQLVFISLRNLASPRAAVVFDAGNTVLTIKHTM